MLYYSEVTNKNYPTERECMEAEKAEIARREEVKAAKEAKNAERKARANEIEIAYKEMVETQNKYRELIEKFVKDYGSYHYSASTSKGIPTLFSTWFDLF